MEYSNTAPSCELNCLTYGSSCQQRTVPKPGCICKSGFVMNCDKKCVNATEYCQKCPFNSYYSDCASTPERSCANQVQLPVTTSPMCTCNPNYIRDYEGNCILQADCPGKFK